MNIRCVILAAGLCLGAATAGQAVDSVKKTTGETVSCRITAISRLMLEAEKLSGDPISIPVSEIQSITFDGEPRPLKTVRMHLRSGRYEDALEELNGDELSGVRRQEIAQDVAFYKAVCAARLAMGETEAVRKAAEEMKVFVHGNTDSYHFLEGCEKLGELYVALGRYSDAETYFKQLGNAPWPEFQMRARVAMGRAQLAQGAGKIPAAKKSFQEVLDLPARSDAAKSQHLAAQLGLASCLAAEKQYDQAIEKIQAILASADVEQVELHARAYNTLGTALTMAGRKNEAIMAFLHVDLLYNSIPDAHAEALAHLAELWAKVGKEERARQAQNMLLQQYKNSRWVKRSGG